MIFLQSKPSRTIILMAELLCVNYFRIFAVSKK